MVGTVNSPEEVAPTAVTPSAKKMRLRYAGVCFSCGTDLPAGTPAFYQRASKTVSCLGCSTPTADQVLDGDAARAAPPFAQPEATPTTALDEAEPAAAGVAGASARREF